MEHRPGQLHGNADGLSSLPRDEGSSVKVERDATLIQSVNMEPLSRESIRAAQNQNPALSQVVRWRETGVRPAGGDVEEGVAQTVIILVTMGKVVSQGRSGV